MSYRAGIIGTGGIAGMGILGMHKEDDIGKKKFQASHAGGYNETSDIELVAIADTDEQKLSRFGDAWDIPPTQQYLDHEEMTAQEDLNVISVCTPSFLHHRHVIDAARSASSPDVIWCEKPIASSVADAEKMISVCEDTDTELLVNHSFRFTNKLQQLAQLIREETLLGNVHSVATQFRMELLRNSTHLLDTLVYLLDSRAERVSGHITGDNEAVDSLDAGQTVEDAGGGGFVLMDDSTFTTIDCTVPRNDSSMMLQFIGSEGKLYMNNDDSEWRYWRLEDGTHIEEPLPGIEDAWTWNRDYQNAFPNAANHIQSLLAGDAENHSPGTAALRSLEIIIGFYISYYTGSQIDIPLQRPLRDVEISSW